MRIIAVLVLAIALPGSSAKPGPRVETWTQIRGGSVWTLTTTVTEVAGPYEWAGELVRFTVRRDGKFVHQSSSFDGGRFSGMKQWFGGPTHLTVDDLVPEGGVGWILHLAESTGNTNSLSACIVTPARGARDSYDVTVVATKNALVQRTTSDSVELWGSYQEWGGGGDGHEHLRSVPPSRPTGRGAAPRAVACRPVGLR